MAGSYKDLPPVDERLVRTRLHSFIDNVRIHDFYGLEALVAGDGDDYALRDSLDLFTVPPQIGEEIEREMERCEQADDNGEEYTIRFSRLTRWYLEELYELVSPYYHGEELEEEWIEYDEEEQEETGEEGYWYTPEREDPCDPCSYHVWQNSWEEFYSGLHPELVEELEL